MKLSRPRPKRRRRRRRRRRRCRPSARAGVPARRRRREARARGPSGSDLPATMYTFSRHVRSTPALSLAPLALSVAVAALARGGPFLKAS